MKLTVQGVISSLFTKNVTPKTSKSSAYCHRMGLDKATLSRHAEPAGSINLVNCPSSSLPFAGRGPCLEYKTLSNCRNRRDVSHTINKTHVTRLNLPLYDSKMAVNCGMKIYKKCSNQFGLVATSNIVGGQSQRR